MFIKFNKDVKQEEQHAEGGVPPVATTEQTPATQAPTTTQVDTPASQEPTKPVVPQLNYTTPVEKQVGSMLAAAGVDPLAARDAITANGGECTPEIYLALQDKHGEGLATMLAGQMSNMAAVGKAAAAEQDKALYKQVEDAFKGVTEQTGAETFKELNTWAKESIPNEQRKELNAALAQGGFVAQLAMQELIKSFQESGDYTQEMEGLEGDSTPTPNTGSDLTKQAYTVELDALLAKGHIYGQSREIAALDARRIRSAQRGI